MEKFDGQEGARHAWASLKSHYPDLPLDPIVLVDPKDSRGNPVTPDAFFDAVLPYACHTERSLFKDARRYSVGLPYLRMLTGFCRDSIGLPYLRMLTGM